MMGWIARTLGRITVVPAGMLVLNWNLDRSRAVPMAERTSLDAILMS